MHAKLNENTCAGALNASKRDPKTANKGKLFLGP